MHTNIANRERCYKILKEHFKDAIETGKKYTKGCPRLIDLMNKIIIKASAIYPPDWNVPGYDESKSKYKNDNLA